MKFLKDVPPSALHGKRVLVRADFNVEHKDAFRIQATIPTIQRLVGRGAIVILMSHRGRPLKKSPKDSLRHIIPALDRGLKRPVKFLPSFQFSALAKEISRAAPGSVFLLENLRFLPGEGANDAGLGKALASLGDIYVNDAFGVDHRKNASLMQIPRLLPAYAGLLLEKELRVLNVVMRHPKKPLVVILGGAKVKDKLGIIKHLLPSASMFLVGGKIANTFLAAKGEELPAETYDAEMISEARRLLRSKKILLPTDFIAHDGKIFDIGPASTERFQSVISSAKTILWSGPLGKFEDPRFGGSSRLIARAIVKSHAFSVVGGGETNMLVKNLGLEKKFGFLSTGGGAMLEYLAGKKLPGIEALK